VRAAAAAAVLSLVACTTPQEPVPGAVDLTLGLGVASPMDVTWDGEAWGVAYGHLPVGLDSEDAGPDVIVFARVAEDGTVLVPPRVIYAPGVDMSDLELTAGTGGYLIWYRRAGTSDITTLGVTLEGIATGRPVMVARTRDGDYDIDVAWNGEAYGLLYKSDTSPDDLSFRRISAAGRPMGAPVPYETRSTSQNGPALAPSGRPGVFRTVWREDNRIWSGEVDLDGQVVTAGARVDDNSSGNFTPQVAVTADGYIVSAQNAYREQLRVHHVRGGMPVWPEPGEPLPQNRDSWMGFGFVVDGDRAIYVYQSDVEHPAPQILRAPVDLATGTRGGARILTDPFYSWSTPVIEDNGRDLAMLIRGIVNGNVRVYLLVEPLAL